MIGILSRTFGTDACHEELNALLAHHERIVALDIAGDESGYPAIYSPIISAKPVTSTGPSPPMPEKPPAPPVSGRLSATWVHSASVTV